MTGGYAVTGLVALIQISGEARPSLFPLVPFAMWVVVFLFRGWKTGYAHFYALAVVPGIVAAIAWPIEDGSLRDLRVLFGAVGFGLAVTGGWTLRRFLRSHPIER